MLRRRLWMLDVYSFDGTKLIVDATFPAFQAMNKTRVVTIEFDELPELLSRRKFRLSDNGNYSSKRLC